MIRYFYGSITFTILGFIGAYLWAQRLPDVSPFAAIFSVFFLSILEVTLSFDNAIVNAQKLEHMSVIWRKRFMTWGILLAVFGTRIFFPVLFVALFSHYRIYEVVLMAINDVDKYAHTLHEIHAPLITFGGTFMMMLFLSYFICASKETHSHWIGFIERPLAKLGNLKFLPTLMSFAALGLTCMAVKNDDKIPVLISGSVGIILYILINWAISYASKRMMKKSANTGAIAKTGFLGFMYLEIIDASFSLDGVLSAFAITKDIVIMAIGLAIGAMFVRSFTIYMVEKKTLKQFAYLESGAHWAIGSLAIIMLFSAFHEVPEVVTGTIALVIIVASFTSSILKNKKS